MFLFDWFRSILQYFGLVNKKASLLIIGLDNAGKSTLLSRLSAGRLVQHPPTNRAWSQELQLGKITFTAYDLGGHKSARRVWRDYFPAVDGIVFMIDVADTERFPEVREELIGLLTDEQVADVPILIFGNKIDRHESCSKEYLISNLGIEIHLSEKINSDSRTMRPCHLVMGSLVKQVGYGEGFKWLAKQIEEQQPRT